MVKHRVDSSQVLVPHMCVVPSQWKDPNIHKTRHHQRTPNPQKHPSQCQSFYQRKKIIHKIIDPQVDLYQIHATDHVLRSAHLFGFYY
jgi:hypothetical protein